MENFLSNVVEAYALITAKTDIPSFYPIVVWLSDPENEPLSVDHPMLSVSATMIRLRDIPSNDFEKMKTVLSELPPEIKETLGTITTLGSTAIYLDSYKMAPNVLRTTSSQTCRNLSLLIMREFISAI